MRAGEASLPRSRGGWWFVAAMLLVAFVARSAVILATSSDYVPVADAAQFDEIASRIVDGEGYGDTQVFLLEGPSAWRGPTYPLALAAVYAVAGEHSLTAGRLENAAIGTVLVGLIGLLASMLFGRRVGAVALVLAALHPTLILHTTGLQLDPLMAVLVVGSIAAAVQHRRAPSGWRWPVVAGVLLGLALLTREVGFFAVPPVALLLWAPPRRVAWASLRAPAAALAIAVAMLVPWTIRNAIAVDAFVPTTSNGGYGLAGTYNDTSAHRKDFPAIWLPAETDPHLAQVILDMEPRTEVNLDRVLRGEALDYIRDHPTYVGRVAFWNTVRLYDLQGPEHAEFYAAFVPYSVSLSRIAVFGSYGIYMLTLLCLALRAARGSPRAVWLFPVLATIGFALVSGTIRYRATIEPFLVIAAAAAVVTALDRWAPNLGPRFGLAPPEGAAPAGAAAADPKAVLPRTSKGLWVVVGILIMAFGLRAGVVLADADYRPANDSAHFDQLATSVANGDGYGPALFGFPRPSAYRAPLYPLSLAAVYVVAGDHAHTAGRLANGLVGTALVALIGVVAAQLWGRRAGVVALAIAAVHPMLILHGSSLMSEPLLALLVMGATAAALQHRRQPHGPRWLITAGVLIGLAALTRETGFLLVPGLALLVWPGGRDRRSLRAPVLVAVAAVAVVVPWTARNAVQMDAFIPVSTSGGYSFAGTYNQTAMDNERDPAIWIPPPIDPAMAEAILDVDDLQEVEIDEALRGETIEFALDHPGYVPKVLFWNTVRLFDLQGSRSALEYAVFVPYPSWLTRAGVYGGWVVGLLALGGLALGATRRTPVAVWIFPVLAFVLHVALSANIRYRATLEPFTVLLATYAVAQLLTRLDARRQPT